MIKKTFALIVMVVGMLFITACGGVATEITVDTKAESYSNRFNITYSFDVADIDALDCVVEVPAGIAVYGVTYNSTVLDNTSVDYRVAPSVIVGENNQTGFGFHSSSISSISGRVEIIVTYRILSSYTGDSFNIVINELKVGAIGDISSSDGGTIITLANATTKVTLVK